LNRADEKKQKDEKAQKIGNTLTKESLRGLEDGCKKKDICIGYTGAKVT
jgi:hypothetical protein